MPIYQYDCAGCGKRVDVFFRSVKAVTKPSCPECGGKRLTRVMSRFARTRNSGERLEAIDVDAELGRLDPRDQGSFARWARRLGEQYDDELGSDFKQLAEKTDAGLDPVERADAGFTLRNRISRKRASLDGSSEAPAAED